MSKLSCVEAEYYFINAVWTTSRTGSGTCCC
jgi:hypothetical protein